MSDRFETEAPEHKYFTMMLNMAEEDLDPFQYRLLAHYVRWSSTGNISEGVRITAKKCKISVEKMQTAREELVKAGYLRIIPPAKKGQPTTVIVVDRWAENVARFVKQPEDGCTKYATPGKGECAKSSTSDVSEIAHIEEQGKNIKEKDFTPPVGAVETDAETESDSSHEVNGALIRNLTPDGKYVEVVRGSDEKPLPLYDKPAAPGNISDKQWEGLKPVYALGQVMDIIPVGKDIGLMRSVTNDLRDAGILPEHYADFVAMVKAEAAAGTGWKVTPKSLTANGRMSQFVARGKTAPPKTREVIEDDIEWVLPSEQPIIQYETGHGL